MVVGNPNAVMDALQLNIRLTPQQSAKLTKNASALGVKPTEYVRTLLNREEEYLSGKERVQRAIRAAKAMRKAGLIPA